MNLALLNYSENIPNHLQHNLPQTFSCPQSYSNCQIKHNPYQKVPQYNDSFFNQQAFQATNDKGITNQNIYETQKFYNDLSTEASSSETLFRNDQNKKREILRNKSRFGYEIEQGNSTNQIVQSSLLNRDDAIEASPNNHNFQSLQLLQNSSNAFTFTNTYQPVVVNDDISKFAQQNSCNATINQQHDLHHSNINPIFNHQVNSRYLQNSCGEILDQNYDDQNFQQKIKENPFQLNEISKQNNQSQNCYNHGLQTLNYNLNINGYQSQNEFTDQETTNSIYQDTYNFEGKYDIFDDDFFAQQESKYDKDIKFIEQNSSIRSSVLERSEAIRDIQFLQNNQQIPHDSQSFRPYISQKMQNGYSSSQSISNHLPSSENHKFLNNLFVKDERDLRQNSYKRDASLQQNQFINEGKIMNSSIILKETPLLAKLLHQISIEDSSKNDKMEIDSEPLNRQNEIISLHKQNNHKNETKFLRKTISKSNYEKNQKYTPQITISPALTNSSNDSNKPILTKPKAIYPISQLQQQPQINHQSQVHQQLEEKKEVVKKDKQKTNQQRKKSSHNGNKKKSQNDTLKRKRNKKIECKKCGRIFPKAEALGGHISKAHPADNSAYLAIPSKNDQRKDDSLLNERAKKIYANVFGAGDPISQRRMINQIKSDLQKGDSHQTIVDKLQKLKLQ